MPRILETLAGLWPGRAKPAAAAVTPLHAGVEESKASATGPLIVLETLGRPVWTPRDYEAFAREGFMQNAIVYRAVRMIAEAAASVPLMLFEGDEEHEDHPLLDLLAKPSLDQTGTDFLEAWYGYLLVAGNAYVEAVALDGRLRELHALRPDRMKVVPGAEGWPEAYEYTCAGRTVRFEEEPVSGVRPILHVRLFHPANDHYGMSPVEAAAQAIDIHNTSGRWNKALLDNSARPSGALVYGGADGRMTPEQFERLKAELEDGFQGPRRAGRPLLLEGGLDWKPLSLSPKDMDFIAARNGAAREIALAFGVPPMLLGIPGDNTFSNYQEAQRAFWRSTVLPLVTRTAKALASWLAPAYGTSLDLKPDLDQIEALTAEREALWARIEKVSFLTLNEKRAAVGYAPLDEPPPEPATEVEQSSVLRKYPAGGGRKYRPDQARAPSGDSDGGQWVDEGGGSGSRLGTSVASGVGAPARDDGAREENVRVAQAPSRPTRRRGDTWTASPAQETQLRITGEAARRMRDQVRQLDPSWNPRPSVSAGTAEGAIRRAEGELAEAQARWAELTRDAVPSTNPLWGANRLRKELGVQGYRFTRPTDAPGSFFESDSGAQVRIMVRPTKRFRTDPQQKHEFEYYYRYRKNKSDRWGQPIPLPNKVQSED
jgi:HK97 family phage portal protein